MQKKNRTFGFTMLEMVMVLAIISLVAGLVLPFLEAFQKADRWHNQKKQSKRIEKALKLWAEDLAYRNQAMGDIANIVNYDTTNYVDPSDYMAKNWRQIIMDPSVISRNQAGTVYMPTWFDNEVSPYPTSISPTDTVIRDAWDHELIYVAEEGSPFTFSLVSRGADSSLTNNAGGDPTDLTQTTNKDNFVYNIDLMPIFEKDNQNRVGAITQMISLYNQKRIPSEAAADPIATGTGNPATTYSPFLWSQDYFNDGIVGGYNNNVGGGTSNPKRKGYRIMRDNGFISNDDYWQINTFGERLMQSTSDPLTLNSALSHPNIGVPANPTIYFSANVTSNP